MSGIDQSQLEFLLAQEKRIADLEEAIKKLQTIEVPGAQYRHVQQTLTDQANIDWNLFGGQAAQVTLTANRTMNAPTNMRIGTYILIVVQGGSGGYTINWNAVFEWATATPPTLSTAVGAVDMLSFYCNGSTMRGAYVLDLG